MSMYSDDFDYASRPTEELVVRGKDRLLDAVFEDEVLQRMAHTVACRQLGFNPDKVVVGGDQSDADRLANEGMWCLQESDPRYEDYWHYSGAFWVKILGTATVSATMNFRY